MVQCETPQEERLKGQAQSTSEIWHKLVMSSSISKYLSGCKVVPTLE